MKKLSTVTIALCVLALMQSAHVLLAGPLPGAIFTTLVDGSRVNANIYGAKEDVYLDGGPGLNAPIDAAGLPEGDYYFQVTGPAGKVLLSADDISCRRLHVSSDGVIDFVYPATCLEKTRGRWVQADCTRATGNDLDHDAVTIQLMPYDNTPNRGGVYKVWVTRVEDYDEASGHFGFTPACSKTDNFKVKGKKPVALSLIIVQKFDDCNANGVWEEGEQAVTWCMTACDPVGSSNLYWTSEDPDCPLCITACEGTWTLEEDCPCGWLQTALYVDGQPLPVSPTAVIPIEGFCGETHEVVYGNIELGVACGEKWYDRNRNGVWDAGEPPIAGWMLTCTGTNCRGELVDITKLTGADGKAVFSEELLPGTYTIAEVMPSDSPCTWIATTDQEVTLQLDEGGSICARFGNVALGAAAFATKGYWHNKNGVAELTQDCIQDCVDTCAPYSSPSTYFGAGDEPLDGTFADGAPVEAAHGSWGERIAPTGSWQAEVSHFLVDSNAGGDPCEQLAQQLLAFIFNCCYRLDGRLDTTILVNGEPGTASDVIADAVAAWQGTAPGPQVEMTMLLDSLNSSTAVEFIYYNPCPVSY